MTFREPLISVVINPPDGLTKTGNEHEFQDITLQNLYQTLTVITQRRANLLRVQILETYIRRSSGETARSVQADRVTFTERGVEAGISIASRALRFITNWAGNTLLPRTVIEPQEAPRLAFMGREGKIVLQKVVVHPGFTSDPIAQQMAEFQGEVEEAVIGTVARSTADWVDGLGEPISSVNLRRQYRYKSPTGR